MKGGARKEFHWIHLSLLNNNKEFVNFTRKRGRWGWGEERRRGGKEEEKEARGSNKEGKRQKEEKDKVRGERESRRGRKGGRKRIREKVTNRKDPKQKTWTNF